MFDFQKYLMEVLNRRTIADFICQFLSNCKLVESNGTFVVCETYKSAIHKIQPKFREFYEESKINIENDKMFLNDINSIDDVKLFFRDYVSLCNAMNSHCGVLELTLSKSNTIGFGLGASVTLFNEFVRLLNVISIETKKLLDSIERVDCVEKDKLHAVMVNFVNETPVVRTIQLHNYEIDHFNS
jgi:hypothetical protein